ncbi:DUF2284 domain-containing protein [Pontiellaceae bacterium B1224]|nr:DUF2284 domain-containing protein [Pontiellaceae bacterium B1224]
MFEIRQIETEELLEAFEPDEIWGHCSQCGNHAAVWSCPPHRFEPVEWIRHFRFSYVVVATISLAGFEKQAEAIEYYYEMRRIINDAMRGFEPLVPGSVSLYAGHCDACAACTRVQGMECVHPERCRYSLESLGLKVSAITETYFEDNLEWVDGQTPDRLLVIPALLSPVEINQSDLFQALEKSTRAFRSC